MKRTNNSITILIAISIIGVFAIISWIAIITPMLKNDFAAFEDFREYVGKDAYVESINGKLPNPITSKDILEYSVVNVDGNILEIKSTYITFDAISGKRIYENTNTFFVKQTTREHVGNKELYFIFPYDVQKQNYLLLDPNMEVPATFVFKKIKYIDDLEVYVFSCENFGADFSDAWPKFAPIKVYGDQTCETSIEPITGKTVQFSVTWDMYVIQDSLHSSIERGESKTTEFTEHILLQSAKDTKQLFYIYDFIIPIFIILIFIGIFFAGIYNNISKHKDKIIIKQYEEIQQANKIKIGLLEQQAKQEKLSIIGQLASRMAHDIRNPLSVIRISLENLKMKYGTEDSTKKQFDTVERSIDRISHQIDDVLDFVKNPHLKPKNVKISEIIAESLNPLKIPDGVELILPKNDVDLFCDKKQCAAAMNNLIFNGIQAIDGIGTIEITAEENDDAIIIQVKDSGIGIPKENLNKIFEPLFTTKQSGTGLGLSSVQSIIESHGGIISVTSPPTIFTITFPKISN